ncbi:leucine-rich repeat-containing protein 14B-like [Lissotriton helveticus]
MKTLKFLSAEALVSQVCGARGYLTSVAQNLYPLLFKASYVIEQGEIIRDLVKHWPLKELDLAKLLGETDDHPEDISHWSCRVCLEACLTGLLEYVMSRSASDTYTKRLELVDFTGIKDVEFQSCKCKKTLGKWSRTERISQLSFDLLVDMQEDWCPPAALDMSVDVLTDLFVTERNYDLVEQALLMRCHSPLKIRCVTFRADSLATRKLFYLIKLAEPDHLKKLEIVHNIKLDMGHLDVLLSTVTFPELTALTLPTRTFNVQRFTAEDETVLSSIGEKLGKMSHLCELSVAFSTLTGRIRKLLSPLKTPLKVLDVAYCSLNHADMAYLANSLHSEHLQVLDLSGHNVADLYPSTFFKLLSHASRTLKTLILEECNIDEAHVHMMILGLTSCRKLKDLNLIGNPLSSRALKCLFKAFVDFPMLKYIEFPVPRDCYPDDVTYPLDETSLTKFDHQRYEEAKEALNLILFNANRNDILTSTPLFGSYDPDIHETSHELGVLLLKSFKDVLDNFSKNLKNE